MSKDSVIRLRMTQKEADDLNKKIYAVILNQSHPVSIIFI